MNELPPILFLHGLVTSSKRTWGDNGWLDLVDEANRKSLPIDLPGHGTEYNPSTHFNGSFIDSVDARIPFKKVDAVAFSLGAKILLKLAIRNPAQFRKIVIAGVGDSLFEPDELHGKKIFTAISGNENSDDPESRYFSQLADHPDINGKFIAECLQQEDMSISPAHLNAVNLPVLVVLGDRDFARPATTLIESLPEANLITLKGVDHFATPKDFTFIESALEFLDSAPSW